MKKLSFLALAAAGLLFGACSEKDVVVQENENSLIDTNGDSYVGISIQLPSATSNTTRANDDLNNGVENEFKVYNGYMLLFKGSDANSATYIGNYPLMKYVGTGDNQQLQLLSGIEAGAPFDNDNQGATNNSDPQEAIMGENGTNITSTGVVIAKITDLKLTSSQDLYAYVILNANLGNQFVPTESDITFGEWSKKIWNVSETNTNTSTNTTTNVNTLGATLEGVISSTGMLMTNSPVSDIAGGSNDPKDATISYAYRLDKTKIKKTAEEAKDAPAGCIFVERAAAKVTVEDAISGDKQITDGTTTLNYTIQGWQVINVEPAYYNVRQAADGVLETNDTKWISYFSDLATTLTNTKYRFVTKYDFAPTLPSTAGHTIDGARYRTYFCKDPHFNVDATTFNQAQNTYSASLLSKTVAIDEAGKWLTVANGVSYVPENTFDVAHQTWKNTTMVTLKVKFGDGDLYTINGDPTFYTSNTINDAITAGVQRVSEINKYVNDISKYIKGKLTYTDNSKPYLINISIDAAKTGTDASNALAYNVTPTITCKKGKSDTAKPETSSDWDAIDTPAIEGDYDGQDFNAAVAAAKSKVVVALYKGGMSYYNVRIQHFGESETPWNSIDADNANADTQAPFKIQPGENVQQIYGYTDATKDISSKRFLGRYGVVRDNWYILSVSGIGKLGSAVPEDVQLSTTPDDQIEEEYYISAHVHILPWVLRKQNVTF